MRVSHIAVLSAILLHAVCCLAQVLEDRIVDKDLYAVLGVKASASIQEIKKAFRKLAQTHHPDKARTGAKAHTSKFQDISEAYDILTNKALRDEYDSRRFIRSTDLFDMNDLENTDGQHGAFWVYETDEFGGGDMFVEEYAAYPEFSGLRDVPFSSGYATVASVAGPVLRRGQVMFPYDEILASLDGGVFALLDKSCSLVVYRGDVGAFARGVSRAQTQYADPAGAENSPFRELFRSESFAFLQGKCAGVLDYNGVFHICMRDQYGDMGDSVWSTRNSGWDTAIPPADGVDFVMELSGDGELAIRKLTQPTPWEPVHVDCVWSTLSCSPHVAAARQLGMAAKEIFRGHFSVKGMKDLMRKAIQRIALLLVRLKSIVLSYICAVLGRF